MLLVDIRRDLGDEERMLIDLMAGSDTRVVLAVTKADKVGFGERMKRASAFTCQSGLKPVITSAVTGGGMDELWALVTRTLRGD